jgi:ribosome-binding protein aMBF1 (putative translation factor)
MSGNGIEAQRKDRTMTTRHIRWERTGADEHAAAYEEARAALLLGQMVHDRRTELGLTQADLADRAGMTQPQLSRLESGGATPTVPLLDRLAAALDADLDIAFRPHTPAAA